MSETTFDYASCAKRVTSREVAAARLTKDYAALVAHFGLDGASASTVLTATARTIVIDGAPEGANVTESDLTGRDPGADAKMRAYWCAARAVRIGLVTAIGADAPAKDVDWLRLVRQSAENAHTKGEFSVDAILAAVAETLNGSDES